MKNSSKLFWGVILIVLGVFFLIDTTGLLAGWHINIWSIIWTFWPLVLIFFGIELLFKHNITGSVILLLLGIVFLATNVLHWNFFAVLWPMVIIVIGLSIIFKKEGQSFNSGTTYSDEDRIDETIAFWGIDKKVTSKNFCGGEINVAFGGAKIDLREAKVSTQGAKLQINAAFGGVEVFVPKDCRVITNGTGIFGGWEPTIKPNDIDTPVLEISGVAAFGGVDIKD